MFLAPGPSFMEDSFPGARGGYEFQDDSNTLHLLCTLFLLLLHQLHLSSSGIRSRRSGDPCLKGQQIHHKSKNNHEGRAVNRGHPALLGGIVVYCILQNILIWMI